MAPTGKYFLYSGETNFRHKIAINTDLNCSKVFPHFPADHILNMFSKCNLQASMI